ncbi:CLUMA_CG015494, isoform A [Clunio marinus]|uniref:CLUMA_CG015494, isoform A n=1 Tax=Clunio marinus TaxID=568069 RepID=A0A1J1IRJ0_9DIPT|nr:CLUMA_CG015494, isoform A [Clunio marinus]
MLPFPKQAFFLIKSPLVELLSLPRSYRGQILDDVFNWVASGREEHTRIASIEVFSFSFMSVRGECIDNCQLKLLYQKIRFCHEKAPKSNDEV